MPCSQAVSRRLRQLLQRLRGADPARAASGPIPGPAAAVDAAALREQLSRWPGAACLDLRPPGVLAHGIVTGSWLLSPEELATGPLPAAPAYLVLAETDTEAEAGVVALRERGLLAEAAPTLARWRVAGAAVHEPAWKSPLPVRHAVRVSREALPEGADSDEGVVQDVAWTHPEFTFAVAVVVGSVRVRLDDLVEEQLQSLGPRGAAGMGETL